MRSQQVCCIIGNNYNLSIAHLRKIEMYRKAIYVAMVAVLVYALSSFLSEKFLPEQFLTPMALLSF